MLFVRRQGAMKVEKGLSEENKVSGNGYTTWYPPCQLPKFTQLKAEGNADAACNNNATSRSELKVNNSLIPGKRVPFAPREGNKVLS